MRIKKRAEVITTKKTKEKPAAKVKPPKAASKASKKPSTAVKPASNKLAADKQKQQKPVIEKASPSLNNINLNQTVRKKKPMAIKPSAEKTPSVKSEAKLSTTKMDSETISKANQGTNSPILPYDEKPGENYMNIEQREHFRHMLQHWKRQLIEEVERTVHHMQDEAANFPDPNDRATQEEEFSLELRTRDRERQLIKKIDEALQKIDTGDYGYCDACGIEIGIRRLEARPTATLCIDCKTIDEIKERQRGGGAI